MPETVDLSAPKPVYVFEELYNLIDQCIEAGDAKPGPTKETAEEEKDMMSIKILVGNMKSNCPQGIWDQLSTIPTVARMSLKAWTLEVAKAYLGDMLAELEKSVGMVSWKEDFGGWEVYEAFLGGSEKSMAFAYDEATAKIIVKALVA